MGGRDALDPKGLIAESYRIEGITAPECRSIFLDWALSLPVDADAAGSIRALLARGVGPESHPMTQVLRDGLADPNLGAALPQRRGGRAGRFGGQS